jgi:hypothetical protein
MVEVEVNEGGEALINIAIDWNNNTKQCIEKANDIMETCKLKWKRNELWDVKSHLQMLRKFKHLLMEK